MNLEHIADIAVDSGCIYISDPATLSTLDVEQMLRRVESNPSAAVLPSLRYTVVSTGGDGLLPLSVARDDDGNVIGLFIAL